MSKMADLIQTVVEPMADVTSAYCGTDWEDVYEGYFEWFCSGADAEEFTDEADWCIICSLSLDLPNYKILNLKRGLLLGAAMVAGNPDAMDLAQRATLAY